MRDIELKIGNIWILEMCCLLAVNCKIASLSFLSMYLKHLKQAYFPDVFCAAGVIFCNAASFCIYPIKHVVTAGIK